MQFLRGCGRRCVHAATSSRQSRDEVQIRSSTSSRRTEMGFFASFLRHFSPSLPGVLPPQLGAFVMGYGQTHLINTQVRTTTTTTTPTHPPTHHHHHCTSVDPKCLSPTVEPWSTNSKAGGVGSARRGRDRRLRSWAKHGRLSNTMALSEAQHHSARSRRGQGSTGIREQLVGCWQ